MEYFHTLFISTSKELIHSRPSSIAMLTVKIIFVCKVIACFIQPSVSFCGDEVQRVYYKSFRCNISEKYVYPNYTCYAKSFNRTCSTVTGRGTAKELLYKAYVKKYQFISSLSVRYYIKASV